MPSIFTRIINGEIPCYKVSENDLFLSFLDINPLRAGHTLVVPKVEVDYIFDLESELIGEMFMYAQIVAKNIKANIKCNRVAIVVLGLDVPHAHIHLIPMDTMADVNFANDKLKLTTEEFKNIQKLIQIV